MAPKADKNEGKANGKTKKAVKSGPPKSTTERPGSVPLLLTATVALLAFIGGLLTPPVKQLIGELMVDSPVTSNDTSTISHHIPHVPCTPTNLDNYFHSTPVNGLHIICIESLKLDSEGDDLPISGASHQRRLHQSNTLRLTFYKNSHKGRLKRRITVNGAHEKVNKIQDHNWASLYAEIVKELGLKTPEKKQPWAIFSALGERIVGETDPIDKTGQVIHQLASSEMVILVEGGSWIWPGVAEGFRRTVDVTSGNSQTRTVSIETLSLKPLVVSIEGFLDNDECDYIADKAGPRVRYSQVSLMDKDKGKAASEWRTSQSAFLQSTNDDVLTELDDRVASLTRIPKTHGEYVQVLRYGTGEKYDAHHDFFNANLYKNDPNTLNLIDGGKKNRFATVFWYLTDVNDGGETIFPKYGGASTPRDFSSCEVGLKVKPQKGKVIIFYSLDAAGDLDDYSLHGACPVGEGNLKWAANKWIWNAPMHFIRE